MTNVINKSLIAALSFLFVMAFSPMTQAAENPFGMSSDLNQQMHVASNDNKCGGEKKAEEKEGKCGDGKAKAEAKCGDGKAKEEDKKDDKKGKCGEGKCGGAK